MSVPPPCYRSGTLNYPGHSAKSAGGRLHLNTHTPLTQRSRSGLTMPLSRHNEGTSGNELTRILSGNTRPQSSQLAEPLWTDPGTTSVSTLKKKKKAQAGNKWANILPKSSQARKKPPSSKDETTTRLERPPRANAGFPLHANRIQEYREKSRPVPSLTVGEVDERGAGTR